MSAGQPVFALGDGLTVLDRACHFSPCRSYRYTLWREWWQEELSACRGCRDCADALVQGYDGFCMHDRKVRCDPSAYLLVIGLNPSTADETNNDPTIRRDIDFAKRWGFGALCKWNLFAWRDTKPANMKKVADPIGPDNDRWLLQCARNAGMILAAWGNHGAHRNRATEVMTLLRTHGYELHCLRRNGDGSPGHTLYIPANTLPQPYAQP